MKMKAKKICMLTSTHRALDTRIFYKEAKTLSKKGYDVVIIVQHHKKEMVNGINIIPLPLPKNRFGRMTKIAWKIFKLALKEKADIYHFHDPELIPIGLLLKLKGKKVIYDIHEDVPSQVRDMYWIPFWIRPSISKLIKFIENIGGIVFDGIITITFDISKRFPKKKTITVQNFPIISEFQYQEVKPYKLRDPIFIYLGTVHITRGIREMVKAIGLISANLKARFLIVGFFPKNIKDDICKMKEWERVNYLSWQPRERIKDLLSKAKVGLVIFYPLQNHIKAQPTKFFEYMEAGIPIVVSDFPVWRKFVENSGCGILVDPLNPNDIARAIQWLFEHPDQAEAMGKRGQEAIKTKYNWGNEAKKLIKFYENLLQ